MGGEQFMFAAKGSDLNKVHLEAVRQAQYDHGHAGYSGTIAEKPEVELRAQGKIFASIKDAEAFAEKDCDNNGKWGPAFAVAYGIDGKIHGYVLYGWASA
jgi:hypothetical protein